MLNLSTSSSGNYLSAIFTIVIFAIVQGIISFLLITSGFRSNSVSVTIAGITALIITLLSCISVLLLWRGNKKIGAWIFILSIAIGVPIITLWITGFGILGLVAIPLVIAWIGSQTLDSKNIRWAISIGITSAVVNLLLDFIYPINRPSMPNSSIIFSVIIVIFVVIAGYMGLRNFYKLRLQYKLLLLFLVISLIPIVGLTYLNNRSTQSTLTDAANQALLITGTQTSNQIDTFFENTKNIIQAEAQLKVLRDFLTNADQNTITSASDAAKALSILQIKDPEYIRSYALLKTDGQVMLRYPSTNAPFPPFFGVNRAVENSLRTTLLDKHQYASPVLFLEDNKPSIIFATAIYDSNDEINPVGLLVIEYDAIILQEIIEEHNELAGADSFGVLFDNYQIHLAHGTDPTTLYKTVTPLEPDQINALIDSGRLPNLPPGQLTTFLPDLSQKLQYTRDVPFFSTVDDTSDNRISQVAVVNIKNQPWKVGFFQPQDVYLSIVNQQTRDAIYFLAFIAIIVTAFSFFASRLVTTPIENLTNIVEHVASGNLSLQVPVITKDEIGRLAVAFNALTSQIRNLLEGLELQVAERTQALERQTVQLQTAAEVARDASNLQDIERLLDRTVNLIHDRFGFYHAGIFLLDESEEFAVLRAANSPGGQEMLRRGHRLKVGQTGIVGYVSKNGKPRISLDVNTDASYEAQTLLPRTRSEMALPLIVGGKIIGALDVQSVKENAFDDDDVTVIQVLADQIAIAIDNARLLSELRQTVYDLKTAYGEYTHESWLKWTRNKNQSTGFRYRRAGIEPTTDISPEASSALKHGKIITTLDWEQKIDANNSFALPIRLRDKTLGVINITLKSKDIPQDMFDLMNRIADRLASALESARLFEETQIQAENERKIAEISTRLRETLDIKSVIQTAAIELRNALNLAEVEIRLGHGKDGRKKYADD